jgi:aldehyde:ferredoxin oxidoreductase
MKKEDSLREFDKKYNVGALGCAFCPAQCQNNYSVPGGDNGGVACFTNITCRFTAKNFDPHVWWKAIARINRYGLDSLEITAVVGWLMLLYEKGYITAEDTDGIPMEWGSEEAILAVIDKIALQEGFGRYFNRGIVDASKEMGDGKGYELVLHDRNIAIPGDFFQERGVMTLGVGGAQLMRATTQLLWFEPHFDKYALYQLFATELGITEKEALELMEEWLSKYAKKRTGKKNAWKAEAVDGKAEFVMDNENCISASDIAGKCDGPSGRLPHCGYSWGVPEIARAVSVATGENWTTEKYLDVLQKKRLMEIAYNILCEEMIGDDPEITDACAEMLTEDVTDGYFKGSKWDDEGSEKVGAEYCVLRGCDPDTGIPTRKELERLGLNEVAEVLEKFGFDLGTIDNDVQTSELSLDKKEKVQSA